MATIIKRLEKGSPLTLQEHDDNFVNLNNELATKATPASVDAQILTAINVEKSARIAADAAEVSNRDAAITAGNATTLAAAKTYADTNDTLEITNRNSAIATAVSNLKGGVSTDGDTLGKLRNLITGTNTGNNTGDETAATIKSKLGIVTLSGVNTGDQTNITGNAATATKFETSRTINGVTFDGTASVVINAVDATSRVASSLLGVANGVATLDSNGLVPAGQLPSYVDDIKEGANLAAFPATGETGKIYVALDTNKTYRWSGSAYVYITSGAVDSVAGKTGVVTLVKGDVGLGNVDNTTDANKPVSAAQATANSNVQAAAATDATTKANAAQAAAIAASAPVAHVGSGAAAHAAVTTTTNGFMIASDKSKLDGIAAGATANTGTVTAVTATAPLVSSGGNAPVISIGAASLTAAGSMSAADKVKLDAITGTNTGDETTAGIQSKLGITTLSGVNTGDETTATIKAKLGITAISGTNTGDQVIPTTLPASDVSAWAKSATKPVYTAAEVGAVAATDGSISGSLSFGQVNLGAPTFNSRSIGTKLDLWTLRSAAEAGYGIGIETNSLWFGVGNNTSSSFKWYHGTTNTMSLTAGGVLTAASFNGITGLSAVLPVVDGTAAIGTSTAAARADHVHPSPTNITGNAGTAGTATYLSATQQTNTILGKQASMAMTASDVSPGSFTCKATGTGDTNLAGLSFYNDAYAIKLGVRADGTFGLGGWSRAAWSWYSDASGNMVAAGNVTAYSDPRLKENVVPIANAIEILKSLNGVRFDWKHGFAHTEVKAGKHDIGVLANEVEAVLPEIVTESIEIEGEKFKTVAYDKLVPVLIEGFKELMAKVEALEAEIKELKK